MATINSGYNGPNSFTKATSDIAIPEYASPIANPAIDNSGLKQLIALQQREVNDIPLWMKKQQQVQPQPQAPAPVVYPTAPQQQMRAMQQAEPAPHREAPIPIFGKMTGGGAYGLAGMMNARPGEAGAVATGYVDPRWMQLARNAGPSQASMMNSPSEAAAQGSALRDMERQAWMTQNAPKYSDSSAQRTGAGVTYAGPGEVPKIEEARRQGGR